MLKYSVPDNKIGRLNKFEFFDLLNRGKDPQFDVFAETACLIANCPSSLIAMIGGDDDFKEIFLNLLINELNQTKNDIDTAAAIKNTDDAKMILHKLKGTAGTAGLFSLSECALKWEKKADDNMDFSTMKKEIIEEITIGLNIIKSLIKYNQKLC